MAVVFQRLTSEYTIPVWLRRQSNEHADTNPQESKTSRLDVEPVYFFKDDWEGLES